MKLKHIGAAAATLLLAAGGALVVPFAASATAPGPSPQDGQCVVDTIEHPAVAEVSHQEYRYSRVTPGQTETQRTEYRFQSRTWIENKKEIKEVEGYDFVDGGTTRVNGKTIGGHWVASPGWHAIPDVIINIVWGPGGVPDQYLGTGRVSLSSYGGPNTTVNYNAHAVDFSGWSDWGPWSDWSTTDPGASSDTRNVESRTVGNGDGTPDVTTYYLHGGDPTSDLTDANWTTDVDPEGWTLVDERKVVDVEAKSAWTEYVYGECPTTSECTVFDTHVITSLDQLDVSESSTDGSATVEIVEGALHVATADTGHRKGAFYIATNFPLSDIGSFSIDQSGTGSQVGGQVRVDKDGDGVWDFTLVDEALYGGIVWASIPGGQTWTAQPYAPHVSGAGGYPNQGTYDDWLASLFNAGYTDPVVVAVGGSLGSGVTGDQTVKSLTAGCVTYTFDLPTVPPVEEPPSEEPPSEESPTGELAQTGAESTPWLATALALLLMGAAGVAVPAIRRK